LQRIPAVQKEFRTALERDDRVELQRLAHRLRGAADLLNAGALSARAGKLEQLAQTGPAGHIRNAASSLLGELGKLSMTQSE
jgi:HPt (histidine-containing phosphotransfer) domain-containing protein